MTAVLDPTVFATSVALVHLRARHEQFSIDADGKQLVATAKSGRALRMLAASFSSSGAATVALRAGAEIVARWHLTGAPLVLPPAQTGWLDAAGDLVIEATGSSVAGTVTLVDVSLGLTNLAKPCAAPEAPARDDSAALQRGDAVSHGPPGAGGKTRLRSQSDSSAPSHTRGAEPAEEPGEPAPVATAGERPKAGASRKGAVAR